MVRELSLFRLIEYYIYFPLNSTYCDMILKVQNYKPTSPIL